MFTDATVVDLSIVIEDASAGWIRPVAVFEEEAR